MSAQLEPEQAARLQEAERRWLDASRVRLRHAAGRRRRSTRSVSKGVVR